MLRRFSSSYPVRGAIPRLFHRSRFSVSASSDPEYALTPDVAQDAHNHTVRWVDEVIVNRGVCPFASRPRKADGIKIVVASAGSQEGVLNVIKEEALLLGCEQSDNNPRYVTTLVVAPHPSLPFARDFHAQVLFSWDILAELHDLNLTPTDESPDRGLQLVNFHPLGVKSVYTEGGVSPQDYVVKSPFPTFHLLREADLFEVARNPQAKPELVPVRNANMLTSWGIEKCKEVWGV